MEFGDASTTIERYRQALKHILLMLVGMAEMGFGKPLSLVLGEAAVAPRPGRAGSKGRITHGSQKGCFQLAQRP